MVGALAVPGPQHVLLQVPLGRAVPRGVQLREEDGHRPLQQEGARIGPVVEGGTVAAPPVSIVVVVVVVVVLSSSSAVPSPGMRGERETASADGCP